MTNLNEEQRRAVNHIYGPCLVLAGPGSGKTHTLVERIRHMVEDEGISSEEILVLTFSKKAACEMKNRFENLMGNKPYGTVFGTFHAVFYGIIKNYYGYEKDSILTDSEKLKILKKIVLKRKQSSEILNVNNNFEEVGDNTRNRAIDRQFLEELIGKISYIKATCNNDMDVHKYLQAFYTENEESEFLNIYEAYIDECKKEKKIDFDDMMSLTRNLFKERENVLKIYQKKYKYILVDEFQDINELQYDLLNMIAGQENNIFAVGDDDQSIYGFRGSRPEIMKRFMNEKEGCIVINLFRNYRSCKGIIDVADKIIRLNSNRIIKHQEAENCNANTGAVVIDYFDNAENESEFIIEQIERMLNKGEDLSGVAIIYRTAKCISILEENLTVKGIPYIKNTSYDNYYDNEHVKDILSYLKASTNINDLESIFRIMNKPSRDIEREWIEDCNQGNTSYLNMLELKVVNTFYNDLRLIGNMKPFAAVTYILKKMGYEECVGKNNLDHKEEVIKEFSESILSRAKQFDTIKQWLSYVETLEIVVKDKNIKIADTSVGKVNMLTAHASKGLEFETVFVVGLQEGIFPHRKATTEDLIEEERRLLYVAVTRAKKNLFILGRGTVKNGKRISRFVLELTEDEQSRRE